MIELVAFDARSSVDDGFGNQVETWVEQFTCRAGYTHLRGGESVIAGRLEGRQPIVVRVRASAAARQVSPAWRMRDLRAGEWSGAGASAYWNGPAYAVRSIIPTADRLYLDIAVEGGVAP